MVEQLPFKQLVLGSNPSRPTIPNVLPPPPTLGLYLSPVCRQCVLHQSLGINTHTDFAVSTVTSTKRIVIVEDHTAIREMLAEILRGDPAYKIVGESGEGHQACELCLELKPDLIVLDARLPGMSGVDILRRISKQLKSTRVMVFSAYETPSLVREMLEAGAHGFVEKTAGLGEFKKGIETISHGGSYFGPGVAALLRSVVANQSPASGLEALTDREREILKLVAESHSTKEIALKLAISVKTVDNHRTNLMRKLDLHDVASLTRYALEIGLIDHRTQP